MTTATTPTETPVAPIHAQPSSRDNPEILKLLKVMRSYSASDLHIKHNRRPIFRIHGVPLSQDKLPVLQHEQIRRLFQEVTPPAKWEKFEREGTSEFSLEIAQFGRFRTNIFMQRGVMSAAIRRISDAIPDLDSLNLPEGVKKIVDLGEGLVLVAGVTGSGKTTTLASIMEIINKTQREHIITFEDPIEYVYEDKLSFVNQREVGSDLESFGAAIRYVLRQDPDVILIGELRDIETFEVALTAAETGHLVFATIHASTATSVISRLLDLYPTERHNMLRGLLSTHLKAILCQRLLKGCREDVPRVPACELMLSNGSIQEAIQKGEDGKILELIKLARDDGMIDFNTSLHDLVRKGLITQKMALAYSPNREALKMVLRGITTNTA